MKAYKVVSRKPAISLYNSIFHRGGRLKSATVRDAALEYRPGKLIVPAIPDSLLFVFGDLSSATAFASSAVPDLEIWLVEAEGLVSLHLCLSVPQGRSREEVARFWRAIRANVDPQDLGMVCSPVPSGTLGCTALTLLEQVI